MVRVTFDLDVLRTFVTGFELGSFARAAERLGRSQSAISTQLRRLEAQAGRPLVRKSGRGLELTASGETLMRYARRLLELNDEAADAVRGADVEGWARFGFPQDFAESWLPKVLARFARAHPKVLVEVQVDRSAPLIEKTLRGELDAALVWGEGRETPHGETVATLPIHWIGQPDWAGIAGLDGAPVPLAAFAPPCVFRTAAVEALDAAGLPWRLAFTSPSLSGLMAAAEGGLAITVRTTLNMPPSLVVLDPEATGLPRLPAIPLALHRAEAEPPPGVARLTDILLDTIRDEIGQAAIMASDSTARF